MRLAALQLDFLRSFLAQDGQNYFVKYLQKGRELAEHERFAIYQESITEGLANALRETYPVCERLVGEDFFSGMAYEYVAQTPSSSPNLFDYGQLFAAFVADFKPAQSLAYLADVCRLELAWHQAYYAPVQAPIDFNALAKISDEDKNEIIFQLPLSSTLLTSNYPVQQIWQANQENKQDDGVIYLRDGGERLLIWRQGLEVRIDSLTEEEWGLLTAISRQIKFGVLCEQHAAEIIDLFPLLIERGWVAGFS